jgi:glycosyltransferase involved in cell wall biosynthesis
MKFITRKFTIPAWVKPHCYGFDDVFQTPPSLIAAIRGGLEKLQTPRPLASIILPVFNEERYLLRTLSSFARLKPDYDLELIVANNNSTDRTQELLDWLGIGSCFVVEQGASFARQAALERASGRFILSADADSVYPENWGNAFIRALKERSKTACVYGKYSFYPEGGSGRTSLAIHEIGVDIVSFLRQYKYPFFNVMGCNSAFRREQALAVGGYDHAKFSRNGFRGEDGFMALHLSQRFGNIEYVPSGERVWTSDRRLKAEGNMQHVLFKRMKRYVFQDFNPFAPPPEILPPTEGAVSRKFSR